MSRVSEWERKGVRECELLSDFRHSFSWDPALWTLKTDMKTKVVHHVGSEWMRKWKRVRVWLLSIDMKTKVVQHIESEWMREWESVLVPSFCLTFRHFLFNEHYCKEYEVWVWRYSDNYFYIIFIFDWSQVWFVGLWRPLFLANFFCEQKLETLRVVFRYWNFY